MHPFFHPTRSSLLNNFPQFPPTKNSIYNLKKINIFHFYQTCNNLLIWHLKSVMSCCFLQNPPNHQTYVLPPPYSQIDIFTFLKYKIYLLYQCCITTLIWPWITAFKMVILSCILPNPPKLAIFPPFVPIIAYKNLKKYKIKSPLLIR